ncbi:lytic murein transglycosylase [Streptomyces sp. HU2014]|uniref:Lytic transglycosylase n=1 Tax=Streptomyces albireticuli TaxID=1940 RepID=A0A1Z2L5Y7_9ACTN|nr:MULTISPECIES: lytic transglycosylase domain-containing protein [Streptomyces]ARZ69709.1 lytic transglycosylase [Streptomyces albireticuli]UQI43324.1 lytic murein transglycosylase [Streptomyces sp. HU2014]
MKILRTRAASVSRQGLCTALLVASLTAAVGVSPPHNIADADDTKPGPDNPQGLPHGTPNLTLPDLKPRSPGPLPPPNQRVDGSDAASGIPATALDAYRKAAQAMRTDRPDCHIPWELIAGIGKVESHHGTMEGRQLLSDGRSDRKILGPRLTGGQFATVRDTDHGRYDDDTEYDRAVGPTQFIPSTWESFASDGNGDGVKDPNNIYDAALGTARYLCAEGRDMNKPEDLDRAILRYNPSREYVTAVLAWMRKYQSGDVAELPGLPGGGSPQRPAPSGSTPGNRPTPTPPDRKPGNTPGGSGGGSTGPAKPAPQKPTPQKPEPQKPTPQKPDPQKPDPQKPTPGKPAPVAHLDRYETAEEWQTTEGATFKERARVRATDRTGKPVAGIQVTFEIIGKTDAYFPSGTKATKVTKVTLPTGKDGVASAPQVVAGDRSGNFPVRATVDVRNVDPVDFYATVVAPHADTLTQVGNEKFTATPNGFFTDRLTVVARKKDGTAVNHLRLTATVTTPDGKTDVTSGPYFKGADGKPTRTLDLGRTAADGTLTLPELFTDKNTGAYALRLTAADGTGLVVHLNVEQKPEGGKEKDGKASPSPSTPATTPSATPTKKAGATS